VTASKACPIPPCPRKQVSLLRRVPGADGSAGPYSQHLTVQLAPTEQLSSAASR